MAIPAFTVPAASPFHIAIATGSDAEMWRVRLLSSAQQAQAATIASEPDERLALPPHERTPPPRGDRHHTCRDAPVEVLAKNEPREQSRQNRFGIEEQRCGGAAAPLEPFEQQHGGR